MKLNNFLKVLAEEVKVISKTKDYAGNNFIELIVTFPDGRRYKETFKTSPFIIRKFYGRLKFSSLKAYQYLKKMSVLEDSEELERLNESEEQEDLLLKYAKKRKFKEVFNLIKSGANYNIKDIFGNTPLFLLMQTNALIYDSKFINWMLSLEGIDVKTKEEDLLRGALNQKDEDNVIKLLVKGVTPSEKIFRLYPEIEDYVKKAKIRRNREEFINSQPKLKKILTGSEYEPE